jgi:branched-chain amino acid transport system permease protein
LILALVNILLASSLRAIKLLGHISLGHIGFALIGAYGSSLLVMKAGFPFGAALLLAGLMSGFLALVLGYPFLRVKGIYFAILTLLTAEALRNLAYYWPRLTGGQSGLNKIPPPRPINIQGIGVVDFVDVHNYYYISLSVAAISLFFLYKLEHSHLGFKWKAIRDADNLALAVGINIAWHKTVNFAIAAFFAGIAGSLFAHYQHTLSAEASSSFGVWATFYLLIYVVLGGENKFAGPIVGTLFVMLVSELARPLGEYQPMIVGGLAIIVVLFMPEGIISLPSGLKGWRERALKKAVTAKDSSGVWRRRRESDAGDK